MRALFVLLLTITPLASFAHDGGHLHPHGIEYGWIIAAALGLGAGYALARWRK